MRPFRWAVLQVTFFAFVRPVVAQITLIPGPQALVAQAPTFISSADFDKDGIQDAVVTNLTNGKVTVLFGSPDGTFSSAVDYSVGRTLRGVRGADMNGDGNPDVVVVNNTDQRVLVLYGQGNGTFQPPPASFSIGSHPIDVAVGNFDNARGNDLVTANAVVSLGTVLLNLGGDAGFNQIGDPELGKQPKRVAAVDVNGDGFDDILALNTGTGTTDDLTVLINDGVAGFGAVPMRHVAVGGDAADLAVTDINGDGVPDVLVLNTAASAVPNQFSVSVLINQTEIVDGKPRGKGFFDIKTPVTLRCPAAISGVLIQCSPNFIAAADFDSDGFVDFAVSFVTRPTAGSTTTPGLLQALAGRGDGTFDFATQVTVGADPEGVVAGDFTGDGIPDIALAEQGARSVRIVRSVTLPLCTERACCQSALCPAGQRCDIPESFGICAPPAQTGAYPCSLGAQCLSGFCVDSTCCASSSCPDGQFCSTRSGECAGPPETPGPGSSDTCDPNTPHACDPGFCTNNVCCNTDSCPDPERCDIFGLEGSCAPPLVSGDECTKNTDCEEPLICVLDSTSTSGARCNPSPVPTPTFIPFTPPVPTGTPIVTITHPCTGDCNNDHLVTIDEIIAMVNAALGDSTSSSCEDDDRNGDGVITVDEILAAVRNALTGCPAVTCSCNCVCSSCRTTLMVQCPPACADPCAGCEAFCAATPACGFVESETASCPPNG